MGDNMRGSPDGGKAKCQEGCAARHCNEENAEESDSIRSCAFKTGVPVGPIEISIWSRTKAMKTSRLDYISESPPSSGHA